MRAVDTTNGQGRMKKQGFAEVGGDGVCEIYALGRDDTQGK